MADYRFVTSRNINDVTKSVWKRERLKYVLFCPLEKKTSQQIVCYVYLIDANYVYTTSRPDKHAKLPKIYFKPLVKKNFHFSC